MEMLPEPMTPVAVTRTHGGNKAFHNFANDYSHISDPNLRRRLALSDIDKVPFGLYHVRAVVVAGIGFFLDSYDIFAINLISTFLGVVFWQGSLDQATNGFGGNDGRLPTTVSQALKASTSAGIVVGQLVFGWLADVFGRRKMYGIELGIIILSTLNCALASPSPSMSSTGLLVFWRVMMGIGIGGDYPLSSIITSEFAPTRWRGGMMAAVFSLQGVGQLLAAIVSLVVTVAFKDAFIGITDVARCDYACQTAADRCWRIIVGLGAVPGCFAMYYRITIPETPRYTFDIANDVEKADADIKAYVASRPEGHVDPAVLARRWKNLRVLMGTTLSWFFLDLAFYGLGLNNSIVLQAIGYSSGETLYHTLYNNAVGMIILTCAGSLPGYWTAVLTIDTLGRKPLQIGGFLVLTLLFCILGFHYHHLSEASLLALYVVAQFFFNWGPNTTTFIVPGECFPTRYRSTGHGLSAATGKIGAIVAQVISTPLLARDAPPGCTGSACSPHIDKLMRLFALFMFCGTLASLLIPETRGVTLEQLAGEPPTSYNAGRSGSIGVGDGSGHHPSGRWKTRWNPFAGGQPAGFSSPRMRAARGPWGSRNSRVGIMTSPELAAENARLGKGEERRRRRKMKTEGPWRRVAWRRRRGGNKRDGDGDEDDDNDDDQRRSSSSTAPTTTGGGGSSSSSRQGPAAPLPSVLPGWGAGWGRIDRGGYPTSLENIRLQDVGSLLK